MEVRLLGPLEVIDDDGMPLPVPGGRQRALLSLLALRPGACVPAERLIDDLWGDRPPQQPAGALQVVVFKLRRIIGADRVTTQPSGYTLEIPTLAVDAHRFEHLARAARDALSAGRAEAAVSHLDDALALWRDTPLSDVRDAPTAASAAVRWETLRTTAHEDRFEALLATGRDAELIADIEAAIAGAPYSERLRAHQMIALYRSGRQADALRAFAETRRVLADDLGIEPGAELRRLELAILNQDPGLDRPSADAGAPPLVVAPTPAKPRRSNLRKPMTAFFGRARDLDGVTDLLSTQRLVTLVGAGGAGKTRLAIEIADRQGGRHPDGVWFVALDRLATGGDVAAAVASGLGLSTADAAGQRDLGATTLLDRLSDAVSERELLVVLDNCEHVIDAAAHVAVELLAAAPGLRVLATSREALRVPGEVVWAVPPLELPDAMQLFVDRAQATVSNAPVEVDPTVAELCRRLDGMPLAIELTAARTNAFTLTQLVERLDDRFRLLTGGARTSLPRQQTLRAVTDWSYDLLFDDERMVFERLSVFSGSCTLEAAEAVCADDDLPVTEIGPIIGRLVDKSLLVGDGNGRYRMLQTLAQYGRERLASRGDVDAVRDRHADYYRRLVRTAYFDWRRPGGRPQPWWMALLTDEGDNLRSATEWAIERGDASTAQLITGYAGWYWWHSGRAEEGHVLTTRAIDCSRTTPAEVRAPAATWGAMLAIDAGHADIAAADVADAIELSERSGDQVLVGMAWMVAAQVALFDGRLTECIEALRAARRAHATVGDRWSDSIAASLSAAVLMLQGRPREAELENAAAIDGLREVGDLATLAITLDRRSRMQQADGRIDDAEATVREAYEMCVRHDLWGWQASTAARLGAFALIRDDHDDAIKWFDASLAVGREMALPVAQATAWDGLGVAHRRRGDLAESSRCHDAAHAITTRFGTGAGAILTLVHRGYVAEEQGDLDRARALHREAWQRSRELGDERCATFAAEGLAAVAAAEGDGELAAALLAHASRVRAEMVFELVGGERRDVERTLALVRRSIGDARFDELMHAPRPADLDEAIGLALAHERP